MAAPPQPGRMLGWTWLAVLSLLLLASPPTRAHPPDTVSANSVAGDTAIPAELKEEYKRLLSDVKDKVGLAAIAELHAQLDDDHDGTIEPSETGDFIKADLQYDGDGSRQKMFHKKDSEITVVDLWLTWTRSEVHNWTVDTTADWLVNNVDLPQYKDVFAANQVNGSQLPRAASDPSFLSKVLGITNTIHRSKISLKAMDVVLFGPPKDQSHWLKDIILSSLLVALFTALFFAYKQKQRSDQHVQKMIKDMESLGKAEKALQDMQSKLAQKDAQLVKVTSNKNMERMVGEESETEEVGRLREEVEVLRRELSRAEEELEDRCWMAPTLLQHWLQLTYELESITYNEKRRGAEAQMEAAKDACEKLKRKRSSLVGAFVSTHGRSIDDVDKTILEAKTSLLELTQDLSERSQRWRQIEMLCGISIVSNPGLTALQRLVRHVGGGNRSTRTGLSSRMSSAYSQDDLADDDARSVAASSHISVSRSLVYPSSVSSLPALPQRKAVKEMSRDSSKESSLSESDDVHDMAAAVASIPQLPSSHQILPAPKLSQSSASSDGSFRTNHQVTHQRLTAAVSESPPSIRANPMLNQRASTPPLTSSPAQRRLR